MLRRLSLILCTVLLALALLAGCSASKNSGGVVMDDAPEVGNTSESLQKGEADLESVADASRKLIRTVNITVQTKEYDTFIESVKAEILTAGGYIESSAENASLSRSLRSASMTLRIPAGEADGVLELIGELGTVVRKDENVRDVTLNYVDTESRIKALRAEEDSLLALLEAAKSVDEIISVRDRLTEVRYEIEAYESTLRTYDNQISYCTVTLYVSEVEKEMVANGSVWSEIGSNLSDAFRNIGRFFRDAFVFLVSALPYLLVFLALPGAILLFAIRLALRRRKKKRAVQTLKTEE